VQLSNKLFGTDVILVNEKVSVNSNAEVENSKIFDGIDVSPVPRNVLLNIVTLPRPGAPLGIDVKLLHP
jgi:hypothetical protein